MFYHNTRHDIPLPEGSPDDISGGIVLASSLSKPELLDRDLTGRSSYLSRARLLDPQVYLAEITVDTASRSAANLGSYDWFRCLPAPYFRMDGRNGTTWFRQRRQAIQDAWPATAPRDATAVRDCITAAVHVQRHFGCDAIILPSPMTRDVASYEAEVRWLDVGLDVCAQELDPDVPVYATIAFDDFVIRQRRPLESPFLQSIAAQVAARPRLAGAYIVLAQESEQDGTYVCRSPDSLLAVLTLVNDIAHLAGRRVIVNGMGPFGVAAFAAGAHVWASSFYRSSRRVRTSDSDDREGFATTFPRYFSVPLLGDIGVRADLSRLARDARTVGLLTDTPPAAGVNAVLRAGGDPAAVPAWEYAAGNRTAAMAHYLWCMRQLDATVAAVPPRDRVELVGRLLNDAEARAVDALNVLAADPQYRRAGKRYSDLQHQRTWRECFDRWREATGR